MPHDKSSCFNGCLTAKPPQAATGVSSVGANRFGYHLPHDQEVSFKSRICQLQKGEALLPALNGGVSAMEMMIQEIA
jgi:hypothetical protein